MGCYCTPLGLDTESAISTVAERGRAFYFHNFQKRSFPIMIISDYEYFSLPKFLDTDFSYLIVANHKKRSALR